MKTKLCGGVHLPVAEEHLVDWMAHSKRRQMVDGKLSFQYHKLSAAMEYVKDAKDLDCIDIGGHIGLWSMHFVKYFKHVHAFEPVTDFCEVFTKNVQRDNYTLHRVGLSDKEDTVSLAWLPSMTGISHILDGDDGAYRDGPRHEKLVKHENAKIKLLDDYYFKNRVGLIKIDVEGFERRVVKGGVNTIMSHRPIMVVEQKGNEVHYGENKDAALEFLKGLGMKDLRKPMAGDHIMGW